MLKPTHKGVHSNGLEIALFSFLRSQFGQELSILSVGPSHKLGDKCDRLHICSRKTHIDCKDTNKRANCKTNFDLFLVSKRISSVKITPDKNFFSPKEKLIPPRVIFITPRVFHNSSF